MKELAQIKNLNQCVSKIKDLNRRISKIFKSEDLLMSIGDVAKRAGISQSKIRYWEKSGYIHAKRAAKNKDHKYSEGTILKIQLIKSYLDSGFTLSTAAKKASFMDRFHNLLGRTVKNRLIEFNIIDGKPALNFGHVNHKQDIWFLVGKNDVQAKLIPIDQNK